MKSLICVISLIVTNNVIAGMSHSAHVCAGSSGAQGTLVTMDDRPTTLYVEQIGVLTLNGSTTANWNLYGVGLGGDIGPGLTKVVTTAFMRYPRNSMKKRICIFEKINGGGYLWGQGGASGPKHISYQVDRRTHGVTTDVAHSENPGRCKTVGGEFKWIP